MPTVLQIVHGYPPRELAGTEMATARLVAALGELGWRCRVLASTRAPGRRQYELIEDEQGVVRVVNNLPFRPLESLERDVAIERLVRRIIERVEPDVVHVQHTAFLSSRLTFPVPAVGTLHDHWPWCPAGGTMLRLGAEPCAEPEPDACVACYAAHARMPGRIEHGAVALAAGLSRTVAPERLHQLWRRLPLSLRSSLRGPPSPPGRAEAVLQRRRILTETWRGLDLRMAPSAYLAREAERRGLGPVRVVPAGVPRGEPHTGGGAFVYLGSILPHKGVHLVVGGYRRAHGEEDGPGLLVHGSPDGDPAYARSLGWPVAGRIEPSEVPALLQRSAALVMGSTWPENAPTVILEARAAGCPVIAPRIGGIPELVEEGRDGLLYQPGSESDLARCVARVSSAPLGTFRPEAPPSPREHAERVVEIYREAMASDSSPPRPGATHEQP